MNMFLNSIVVGKLFIRNALFSLCILIDSFIYKVAYWAMRAFFVIGRINVFSLEETETTIQLSAIMKRVMVLCGIFALFKLSLTLINYIINPEQAEKSGASRENFVKNFIIAVILLMSSSFIFGVLGDFQNAVFDNDVIQKVVYGADESNSIEENALKFVNNVFLTFFVPDEGITGTSSLYYNEVKSGNAGIIKLADYIDDFTYTPIVSGIVGIMFAYYLIQLAISLAVRVFKLLVLQIISPIPIILSIYPSKTNKLQEYGKLYFGIYIQVFVKILVVYLAFVLCNYIMDISGSLGVADEEVGAFIKILIILGLFHAVKEIPAMIDKLFGGKLGLGEGTKGFGKTLGGIIGGATGLVGGAIAGGISGGAGGALAGGFSGLTSGVSSGASAKNAGALVSGAIKNVKGQHAKGLTVAAAGGIGGYALGQFDKFTGHNAGIDRKVNKAQAKADAYKNFETAVYSDYAKASATPNGPKFGTMEDDSGVIAAKSLLERYKMGQSITFNGNTYDMSSSSNVQGDIDALKANIKSAEDNYKEQAFNWFESKKIDTSGDLKDSNGNLVTKYSNMTESQKAYYELKKETGSSLTKGSGSASYKAEFDSRNKQAKSDLTHAKDETKTDRYIHQNKLGGK